MLLQAHDVKRQMMKRIEHVDTPCRDADDSIIAEDLPKLRKEPSGVHDECVNQTAVRQSIIGLRRTEIRPTVTHIIARKQFRIWFIYDEVSRREGENIIVYPVACIYVTNYAGFRSLVGKVQLTGSPSFLYFHQSVHRLFIHHRLSFYSQLFTNFVNTPAIAIVADAIDGLKLMGIEIEHVTARWTKASNTAAAVTAAGGEKQLRYCPAFLKTLFTSAPCL